MTATTIRIFEQRNMRLFRLSPLYAEPGWYGTADQAGTVGPYSSSAQVRQALETLTAQRLQERPGN